MNAALQAANGAAQHAERLNVSADQAINSIENEIVRAERAVMDFSQVSAQTAVERLLTGGSDPSADAADAATRTALAEQIAGLKSTRDALKLRSEMRKRQATEKKAAFHMEARKHIYEKLMPEVRTELTDAWEALRVALYRTAALSHAAEVKFIDPNKSYLPNAMGGPAEEVLRALGEARFPLPHPFDALPSWVRRMDHAYPIPADVLTAEVARAVAAVNAAAESPK